MEEFSKDYNTVKSSAIHEDQADNFEDWQDPPATAKPVKEIKPGLIVGALAILTLTGLFFTVSNWFDSLRLPFARNASLAEANVNDSLDLANNDVANLLALKEKDTDQDGLTDYDELYLYKTSPYIPDSDSDGYADGEEVKSNQDPNCPAGVSCASLTLPGDAQAAPNLPDNLDALTPDQIRSLLLQNGASAEELNSLSDEELINLYQQVKQESQSTNGGDTGLSDLKPADYEAITPEQIRSMLKDQGVSEEDLNNLTDADLRELLNQVISEQQSAVKAN